MTLCRSQQRSQRRTQRRLVRGVGAVPVATVAALLVCAAPNTGGGIDVAGPVVDAASHAPMPKSCGSSNCSEELVGAGQQHWKLRVFRNFPMSGSSTVTRAVIVIHGTGRNAAGYFASMMKGAAAAGVADHTLILAPWFKTSEDKPATGEATWTNDAWKQGGDAESPHGLSSFLVMDQILTTLAAKQRFPNLRQITLTGHSAGGQFTQRYAALGLAPNALSGVAINYAPANPSTYLYFGPARPSGEGFAVPSSSSCADYNQYKYGMAGRSGYPAQLTAQQAQTNYFNRKVTLINGGTDTTQNGDMDDDCGAMMEGPNRAARGANYLRYIHLVAPSSPQSRIVVPGVDHDADAIFTSPLTRAVLFGTGGTGNASNTVENTVSNLGAAQ